MNSLSGLVGFPAPPVFIRLRILQLLPPFAFLRLTGTETLNTIFSSYRLPPGEDADLVVVRARRAVVLLLLLGLRLLLLHLLPLAALPLLPLLLFSVQLLVLRRPLSLLLRFVCLPTIELNPKQAVKKKNTKKAVFSEGLHFAPRAVLVLLQQKQLLGFWLPASPFRSVST